MQDLSAYRSLVSVVSPYARDICVFVMLLLYYLLCVIVTYGMYGWAALG